ncbi:TPA: helix-turn-helix domain-containing protein [Klebsiella pneumoniae]|nr:MULTISPECIES: helix-turn-helix domain-containing protein [Enterobacteriaceae]EJA9197070.1 helix-turn-helix domain-containing protein [Escherichia coli]MBW9589150.1 helix-turn-helix domain-containing protein [Escherichia coli]MBW9627806.1 helix-turn-helix domain-containing protein [Escherichia coli]MCP6775025.1 helix-turn-helix domain-containing protein [Klebsiella pneumoniae]PPJ90438.1 AlpA family transcriptional regulator [Klebsiella pneumoniae]
MKEYLLVPELMEMLRCSRATLYREIRAGRIPKPFRLSRGKSAWHKDDVKRIIEQRRVAANAGQ